MPRLTESTDSEDRDFAVAIKTLDKQRLASMFDTDALDVLDHAIIHLRNRRRRELIPQERPSTEQMALAMLKALAAELTTAGQALDAAAWALKQNGALQAANGAKAASTRALRVAGETA